MTEDPGAAAAAGMMGCPVAPPVVGEMCMGMPGTCTFPNLECDCDGGVWACWDPATCPAAADPAGACTTDGQICQYAELLSCECEGAVWECDRDCPAELPADGLACPELTQECGYSTIMGNGDELTCVCGDSGWACSPCPATSPPAAPNLLACPLVDQECSYDVAAAGNIPGGDNDCTCDATGWLCTFDPDCPEVLPVDLTECVQVGQDCDYDVATGGEEQCECDATGWLCTFVPDCPLTLPADGVACGLVGQDCDFDGTDPANPGETECTCTDAAGTAGWACIFEPDCPQTLPAATLACTLAAQVCDYDNDVGPGGVGGEDVCTCTDEAWACAYQPPCPDAPPAATDACPAPAQECGYSTVMGGGNEIDCVCTDGNWACIDETLVDPTPAPAP